MNIQIAMLAVSAMLLLSVTARADTRLQQMLQQCSDQREKCIQNVQGSLGVLAGAGANATNGGPVVGAYLTALADCERKAKACREKAQSTVPRDATGPAN